MTLAVAADAPDLGLCLVVVVDDDGVEHEVSVKPDVAAWLVRRDRGALYA